MKNAASSPVFSKGKMSSWPKEVLAYTDGASRGNPGPSSFGLSVLDSKGKVIFEEAQCLGKKTNNEAEYSAIGRVLELALMNQVEKLTLKTDSELAVRQIGGRYKVKSKNLKNIYKKCLERIEKIPHFKMVHVLREQNQRADELANLALDEL